MTGARCIAPPRHRDTAPFVQSEVSRHDDGYRAVSSASGVGLHVVGDEDETSSDVLSALVRPRPSSSSAASSCTSTSSASVYPYRYKYP
jgi:hypothetical protein